MSYQFIKDLFIGYFTHLKYNDYEIAHFLDNTSCLFKCLLNLFISFLQSQAKNYSAMCLAPSSLKNVGSSYLKGYENCFC